MKKRSRNINFHVPYIYIEAKNPRLIDARRPMPLRGGTPDDKWFSKFSPEIYENAQSGMEQHPLTSAIESDISSNLPRSSEIAMSYNNTGCMVDIGAYLSGEPDCMVEFDDRKMASKPIKVFVSMQADSQVQSENLATYFASVARACYSLGLSCDVCIQFFACGYNTATNKNYMVLPPEIEISNGAIDAGLLALYADTRYFRHYCIGLIDEISGKADSLPIIPSVLVNHELKSKFGDSTSYFIDAYQDGADGYEKVMKAINKTTQD